MELTPGQFGLEVRRRVGVVTKYAGFDLFDRITQKTPVDTGRARAAWNMAINRSDLTVPDEPPKGTKLPPPTPPDLGEVRAGDEIRITNNLVYIEPLENGHSGQAPNGMVKVSIEETRAAMAPLVDLVRTDGERRGR